MMNRNELLNLVDKLEQKPVRSFDDDILILDGLNTLIRGFSVNRTITSDGVHVGGLQGFLKSVRGKLSNEKFVSHAPEAVVAAERKKEADALSKIESIEHSLKALKA